MQQFILPFKNTKEYEPLDFIVSVSNQPAYDIVSCWPPKRWGHYPYPFSIVIQGEQSSGKTYLSKIWQNFAGACLLSSSDEILAGEWFSKYQAFIIEDLEKWQEEKALYYFNLVNESQKYLLITMAAAGQELKIKDLSSRLNSLLKVKLKPPDDELIKILLFRLFSNNSVRISQSSLSFLLLHLPRRIEEIIKLVDKLNHAALTYKHSLTIPFIKKIIGITEERKDL